MKLILKATLVGVVCGFIASGSVMAGETSKPKSMTTAGCKFSNETVMKDHFLKHVKYPTTGAKIKETCKKEMPGEFTASERACFEGKIKDKATYKNVGEVFTALNVK